MADTLSEGRNGNRNDWERERLATDRIRAVFQIQHLTKRFGDLRAVDGVSFEVRRARCTGLLGPNGAGKTTTMSMLSGLLAPDEGRILFDGRTRRRSRWR